MRRWSRGEFCLAVTGMLLVAATLIAYRASKPAYFALDPITFVLQRDQRLFHRQGYIGYRWFAIVTNTWQPFPSGDADEVPSTPKPRSHSVSFSGLQVVRNRFVTGVNANNVYGSFVEISIYWPLAVGTSLAAIPIGRRIWRRPTTPGHCPTCGYDLRATPDCCPECGTAPPVASRTK